MMEMKIKIEVPDLAAAIEKLAASLNNSTAFEKPCTADFGTQGAPAPVEMPAPTANPTPTPAPVAPVTAPAAPVQTVPIASPVSNAPAPAVPMTAPTYTLDQIAKAGASLVDAGKMEQLLGLLTKYSVQAVTQLMPDQYGAFATELRALGAQI